MDKYEFNIEDILLSSAQVLSSYLAINLEVH